MHKCCWLVGLILCATALLRAQQIGQTTITFIDSSRNNRQIPTEVYYPANAAGTNVPIAAGEFPVLVYGHGFVMVWSAYENIWTSLVPTGYIMAFPKTESGFAPVHAEFGKDLAFLAQYIQQNGAGEYVPATSVANKSAIMRHSMGGGAGFLAAANNTNITTMVSFAAANTNPSAIDAAKNCTIPTLLFSGTNDCVTPPTQHQNLMYDSCAGNYKTQINITGGGHCFFANNNINCSLGESTCTPTPTITREQQQLTTNNFLIPWLDFFLKDMANQGAAFQQLLATDNRISYRQNKPITTPTGTGNLLLNQQLTVYPNPAKNKLNIVSSSQFFDVINLFDVNGKEVVKQLLVQPTKEIGLEVSNLNNGIYLLQVNKQMYKIVIAN
jgi:dienelactone hydrolase